MKKILGGLLVGTLFSFAFINVEAILNVTQVTYKVFIKGTELKTDLPILNYEGRTYLPLRAVGEALGVSVNWDGTKRAVQIGETTSDLISYGEFNPAPLNTLQKIIVDDSYNKISAEMKITEINRGPKAFEILKEENINTQDVSDGAAIEYLIAKVYFKINKVEEGSYKNQQFYLDLFFSGEGNYNQPKILEPRSSDLYAGTTFEDYFVFIVNQSDKKPKLAFGRKALGVSGISDAIWFQAY
jgi:hypothetical protein